MFVIIYVTSVVKLMLWYTTHVMLSADEHDFKAINNISFVYRRHIPRYDEIMYIHEQVYDGERLFNLCPIYHLKHLPWK